MRTTILIVLTVLLLGCGGHWFGFRKRNMPCRPPRRGDPPRVLTRKVFDKVNRQRQLHGPP